MFYFPTKQCLYQCPPKLVFFFLSRFVWVISQSILVFSRLGFQNETTCTALVIAAGVVPSKLDGPDEPNELGPANPVELELPLLPASPGTDSLPHSRYLRYQIPIVTLNLSIISL